MGLWWQMIDASQYVRWQKSQTPHLRFLAFACDFFPPLLFSYNVISEGERIWRQTGDWQRSRSQRSQSINRHVSQNNAVRNTQRTTAAGCQIPSEAPDWCDAISLAELGCLKEQ